MTVTVDVSGPTPITVVFEWTGGGSSDSVGLSLHPITGYHKGTLAIPEFTAVQPRVVAANAGGSTTVDYPNCTYPDIG